MGLTEETRVRRDVHTTTRNFVIFRTHRAKHKNTGACGQLQMASDETSSLVIISPLVYLDSELQEIVYVQLSQ